jgi:hypothetical protein
MLRSAGLGYVDVRTEVAIGRWRLHGLQTVALHTGPLNVHENRWRVIWETGAKVAVLDGVTALQAAGLTGYKDDEVHVSVVHSHSV